MLEGFSGGAIEGTLLPLKFSLFTLTKHYQWQNENFCGEVFITIYGYYIYYIVIIQQYIYFIIYIFAFMCLLIDVCEGVFF